MVDVVARFGEIADRHRSSAAHGDVSVAGCCFDIVTELQTNFSSSNDLQPTRSIKIQTGCKFSPDTLNKIYLANISQAMTFGGLISCAQTLSFIVCTLCLTKDTYRTGSAISREIQRPDISSDVSADS
jgi:hypothetical protein